jgi:hypothetical protein
VSVDASLPLPRWREEKRPFPASDDGGEGHDFYGDNKGATFGGRTDDAVPRRNIASTYVFSLPSVRATRSTARLFVERESAQKESPLAFSLSLFP